MPSCPLCENRDIVKLYANLRLSKCRQLGLAFRNPQPTEGEMRHLAQG